MGFPLADGAHWKCEVQWWMWPAPQISVPKVTLGLDLSSYLLHGTNRIHNGTRGLPPGAALA